MFSKQISAFVENKKGRLAEIMAVLKRENVNLRALSLADTTDFGVLRFIADNPEAVAEILKSNGILASVSTVVTVKLKDEPGSLSDVLEALAAKDISVEYAYAFIGRKDDEACVVLRTNDDEKAAEILKTKGYTCPKVK